MRGCGGRQGSPDVTGQAEDSRDGSRGFYLRDRSISARADATAVAGVGPASHEATSPGP